MADLLEVGRIARAHGVRGDVLIVFSTDKITERTAPGANLVIGDTSYEVVKARPHQKYQLVTLAGVKGKDEADLLRGKVVLAEAFEDPDTVFIHEVIGATVVDGAGVARGTVVSVVDNPASDLLELDSGALVPMTFLVKVVDDVATVDVPDGLFELTDDPS